MDTQIQKLSEIIEQARVMTLNVLEGAEYSTEQGTPLIVEEGNELTSEIGRAIALEILPFLRFNQHESRWYVEKPNDWARFYVLDEWNNSINGLCRQAVGIIKGINEKVEQEAGTVTRAEAISLYFGLRSTVVAYFLERSAETVKDAARCTRKTAECIDYHIEEGQELTKDVAEYMLGEVNRLYHLKDAKTAEDVVAYNT